MNNTSLSIFFSHVGASGPMIQNWNTAAHYQLVHSVVMLAVPFCRKPKLAGGLFVAGTMLFSGSLYAMVLTDVRKLGAITPIGGLLLCAGWVAMLL